MERVINNELQPVVLEDGTMIPAGSTAMDVNMSDKDRRLHVATGRLTIIEPRPAQSQREPAQSQREVGRQVEKETNES